MTQKDFAEKYTDLSAGRFNRLLKDQNAVTRTHTAKKIAKTLCSCCAEDLEDDPRKWIIWTEKNKCRERRLQFAGFIREQKKRRAEKELQQSIKRFEKLQAA